MGVDVGPGVGVGVEPGPGPGPEPCAPEAGAIVSGDGWSPPKGGARASTVRCAARQLLRSLASRTLLRMSAHAIRYCFPVEAEAGSDRLRRRTARRRLPSDLTGARLSAMSLPPPRLRSVLSRNPVCDFFAFALPRFFTVTAAVRASPGCAVAGTVSVETTRSARRAARAAGAASPVRVMAIVATSNVRVRPSVMPVLADDALRRRGACQESGQMSSRRSSLPDAVRGSRFASSNAFGTL